jgi:hypothetical protein
LNTIKIFKFDGTLQCSMGKEITLEEMQKEIVDRGVQVLSKKKDKVPYYISDMCGLPTGEVNVFEISAKDYKKINNLGYILWVFDNEYVEVFKYDGTLQCGMGKEITLIEMEKELTSDGIEVFSKAKGNDGLFHIQSCGASTGDINVFKIKSLDIEKSKTLGFKFLCSKETILQMQYLRGIREIGDEKNISKEAKDGGDGPFPFQSKEGHDGPFPW